MDIKKLLGTARFALKIMPFSYDMINGECYDHDTLFIMWLTMIIYRAAYALNRELVGDVDIRMGSNTSIFPDATLKAMEHFGWATVSDFVAQYLCGQREEEDEEALEELGEYKPEEDSFMIVDNMNMSDWSSSENELIPCFEADLCEVADEVEDESRKARKTSGGHSPEEDTSRFLERLQEKVRECVSRSDAESAVQAIELCREDLSDFFYDQNDCVANLLVYKNIPAAYRLLREGKIEDAVVRSLLEDAEGGLRENVIWTESGAYLFNLAVMSSYGVYTCKVGSMKVFLMNAFDALCREVVGSMG